MKYAISALAFVALFAIGCAVHADDHEPKRYYADLVGLGKLEEHLNSFPSHCHYINHEWTSLDSRVSVVVECNTHAVNQPEPAPQPTPTPTPIPMPATGSDPAPRPVPTPTPNIRTFPGPGGGTQCNIDGQWYPLCVAPNGQYAGCNCHLGGN